MPTFMVFKKKVRLCKHLLYGHSADESSSREKYAVELTSRKNVHKKLRKENRSFSVAREAFH